MTKLTEFEKMSTDQLEKQRQTLRDQLKSGMSWGKAAWIGFKNALFGATLGGVVYGTEMGFKSIGSAVKSAIEGAKVSAQHSATKRDFDANFQTAFKTSFKDRADANHKVAFKHSAITALCVAVPMTIISLPKARKRIETRYNTELTHIERILKERELAVTPNGSAISANSL